MITNTTAKTTYTVAEGVDTYAIGFEFDYNPDSTPQIKVFKNKQPDEALVFGVDYTISPDNLNIIISSGVEVGERIDIVRNILFRQLSDYIVGRIDPEQIENDFDASVMRDQQLKAYIDNLEESPIDHEERLDAIEAKIPTEATAENQLADKQFVTSITNGKIDTNEPIVGGTFTKVQVDTKGLVVEGSQAVLSDISNVTITTPTSGQFLMYDGSDWVNADSSASVSWGAITGTLSSQTDLQNALDAKADVATTLSGYGITDGADIDLSNLSAAGKEVCANMAMPSNSYIDMTLGASGTEYTAPADGYVQLNVNININHGYALIQDMSNGLSVFYRHWSTSNMETRLFMPIKKNGVYIVGHNGVVQVNMFRFIYTQGAQ